MAYPTVDANKSQMIYNKPHWAVSGGKVVQSDKSSIGEQIRLDVYIREALEDLEKERYFTQMGSVVRLPANSGKTIKKHHYIPLLDDRNVNTQGIDATGATTGGKNTNGNLYGSTKDIGIIEGKLPTLTEIGGRVNRVGFTRKELSGTAYRLGFFTEFTKESLHFDDDPSLLRHLMRESLRGAHEIQEDMIGIDLLKGAGVEVFSGAATGLDKMTGESGGTVSVVTYKDLQRLALTLKENRAPNRLAASRGTGKVDSQIIGTGYALYIGYPLEMQMRNMKDASNNPVFIPVEKYAAAGTNTLRGEIGSIAGFRIIVVPEMPEYTAVGVEDAGSDSTYKTSAGRASNENNSSNTDTSKQYYNAYPMLAVATEAFSHLGFAPEGAFGGKGNFKMITKLPGMETADRTDPYGQSGFHSLQWVHGMLIERPEWIAVQWTLAEV
ncbi:hypothetical protein pVco7_gp117 [Vibrio phage pVco-7]